MKVCTDCGKMVHTCLSYCPFCYGIKSKELNIKEVFIPEILTCIECGKTEAYDPHKNYAFMDENGGFYCGCRGWE